MSRAHTFIYALPRDGEPTMRQTDKKEDCRQVIKPDRPLLTDDDLHASLQTKEK